jgi:hypothetical protein
MPEQDTSDGGNETGSSGSEWPELNLPPAAEEWPVQAAPPEDDMCACQLQEAFCQYPDCESGRGQASGSAGRSSA